LAEQRRLHRNGASINGYFYINDGVTISDGATINGFAYLNSGVRIGAGLELNGFLANGWQLYLNANSAAKPVAGPGALTSDARLKKNIQPLDGAWTNSRSFVACLSIGSIPPTHGNQTNTQSGFIAQEVEQVFPDWVTQVGAGGHDKALTADGKVRSLSLPFGYDALVVESIKELRAENLALKARLEKLEKLISLLGHKTE
jgi:hypothetical protein